MDIPDAYAALMQWIRNNTDASDPVLHIHAGMIVLIGARLLTRYPLSHPVPFICVVLAESANEVLNRIHFGSWRWSDTCEDFGYSVFWPAVLFLTLTLKRRYEQRVRKQMPAPPRNAPDGIRPELLATSRGI